MMIADQPPATALPRGIQAALVTPFRDDFTLDERAYVAQLDFVLGHPGINGLLINGHAGENALTTDCEKERIVRLTRQHAPRRIYITSGVYSEESSAAAHQAVLLQNAGADALLVFQPNGWALGAEPVSILRHHRTIHDAVDLPIMLYQAAVSAGKFAYSLDVLIDLIGLDRVLGIKDGSWEVATSELLRETIKTARSDVIVYGSGDEHLLVNYLCGTEGSQVSLATVIPEAIVRLWDESQNNEWDRARLLHAAIQPLARLIYRQAPGSRAVARLKACLKLMGIIPSDTVRAPSAPLPSMEYAPLQLALLACDQCTGAMSQAALRAPKQRQG